MSSAEPLTESDLAGYRLNSEILRYLEAFREQHGLEKHRTRVSD